MAKQRVARTRNNGRWTEARYFGFIRSALRAAAMRWGPKQTAKTDASRSINGERWRFEYLCADCLSWFQGKDVQVDHIIECGSLKTFEDLPRFVERMFCEAEGFQVLCKPCHQLKTNAARKAK